MFANLPTALLNPLVQFDFFPKEQLSYPNDSIAVGAQDVPLVFAVNNRARCYILRVRSDGSARVTIPRRGSIRAAREFAERNVAWLNQQLQRFAATPMRSTGWQIGSEIFFRGGVVKILANVESTSVTFADQTIRVNETGDELRPKIERHLRSLALSELPP